MRFCSILMAALLTIVGGKSSFAEIKSLDIDGISVGMDLKEVRKLMPDLNRVDNNGSTHFRGSRDGKILDIYLTDGNVTAAALGAIWRIDAVQDLGNISISRTQIELILEKDEKKYGDPVVRSIREDGFSAVWEEPYRGLDVQLQRQTDRNGNKSLILHIILDDESVFKAQERKSMEDGNTIGIDKSVKF